MPTPVPIAVRLSTSPDPLIAGREHHFALEGLSPWQRVEVAFIDPAGRTTKWVGPLEYEESWTTRTIYADDAGVARWTRYGGMDRAGKRWVEVGIADEKDRIEYQVEELQLSNLERLVFGARLELYRGPWAAIYFADAVPDAYVPDLEEHLAFTASLLEERLGLKTEESPNIFLLGNDLEFQQAYKSSGLSASVWSGGFYAIRGIIPGIYMRAYYSRSSVLKSSAHEFVHFVVGQMPSSRRIPAWLNEGIAEYYEVEAALLTERPEAALSSMYRSADRAEDAALEERLFPLPELESGRLWNGRTDQEEIGLQYAQSHMLVRYLTEAYGQRSPGNILRALSDGNDIEEAVESAIGVSYDQLEHDFVVWLRDWDDPRRMEARPYLEFLHGILRRVDALLEERRQAVNTWNADDDVPSAIKSWSDLVAESERLFDEAQAFVATKSYMALHAEAVSFLELLNDWLGQDLEVYQSGEWSRRDAVHALRPQIDARLPLLWESFADERYILNVEWPNRIQGIVTGPNREPLEGIGLWAWQGRKANSGFGRTGEDGTFDISVLSGSFTLVVYAGEGCSFVGWYDGSGGITTDGSRAGRVIVDATSVGGIQIKLSARPDDLPRIGHCS